MRNQRQQEAEQAINVRLWTYAEAVKAVPYLRSVVGSLREHKLEWQRAQLQVKRLDSRPGRPGRHALILRAEAIREAALAQDRFNEALRELEALDVYCLDPMMGLALIPFRTGDVLAWFVFDLFAAQGLDGWRFHADPLETRRMLADKPDQDPVDQVYSSRPWFRQTTE